MRACKLNNRHHVKLKINNSSSKHVTIFFSKDQRNHKALPKCHEDDTIKAESLNKMCRQCAQSLRQMGESSRSHDL